MSSDCWEQGKPVGFAGKLCHPVGFDGVNCNSCFQTPGCIQHLQCSSNGHNFGVCSLPDFRNIAAQRMLGQVYMQKDLMSLLLMAIKIIEEREEPEDQNPKENKKDRKKWEREMKSLSDPLKGKWWNSPSNTSAVKFYNALIKEPWTCHQDLLKLLVGCSSLSQGLCWLKHILDRVEPWKALVPQGLRHWRYIIVPASNEGMAFLG